MVLSIAAIVQRIAQQKNCETTHVTLCNSPATCLAIALRDKLLRKLHSVTGPLETPVTPIFGQILTAIKKNCEPL